MLERTISLLSMARTYRALLVLNLLVSTAIVYGFGFNGGGDFHTYHGLAMGILHGEYSYWYPLSVEIPDTFRTPGYPLYVAAVIKLFGGWEAMLFIQFGMYVVAVMLMLRILDRWGAGILGKNIALLLLLVSINIPYYIGTMLPETPVMLALTTIFWVRSKPVRTWWDALAVGALFGFIFQCRPIALLLPFCLLIADAIRYRMRLQWAKEMLAIVVFVATLVPYGLWNLDHHGVFKVTPLEGGGGVMHIGWWAGRIPGYQEHRYWGNFAGDEIIDFVPQADRAKEIAAFNAEWDRIDAQLAHLLTAKDTLMLDSLGKFGFVCRTWNSRYTLERERLLKEAVFRNAAEHPWYTLAFKSYSAVRLWVIGIQKADFLEAGTKGKLSMLYPTLMTGSIFLLSVIVVPLALRRERVLMAEVYPVVLLVLYYTAIHLPFALQARYTTSTRLLLYALVALSLVRLLDNGRVSAEKAGPRPVSGGTEPPARS